MFGSCVMIVCRLKAIMYEGILMVLSLRQKFILIRTRNSTSNREEAIHRDWGRHCAQNISNHASEIGTKFFVCFTPAQKRMHLLILSKSSNTYRFRIPSQQPLFFLGCILVFSFFCAEIQSQSSFFGLFLTHNILNIIWQQELFSINTFEQEVDPICLIIMLKIFLALK